MNTHEARRPGRDVETRGTTRMPGRSTGEEGESQTTDRLTTFKG